MPLIDGKQTAAKILEEIAREVSSLPGHSRTPCVAFIRVGEDPASVSYVRNKEKAAAKVGFRSMLKVFPDDITPEQLLIEVDKLNEDPDVDGILVQSPLPSQHCEKTVFQRVLPQKDVDGFHPLNQGLLVAEAPEAFHSCTPAGLVELLRRHEIQTSGKHVVIVGRSTIVGKPAALLFLRKHAFGDATVTVCHSRSTDMPKITRQADILIAAVGRAGLITEDMVKPGAVVLDVGINRIEDPSRKSGFRLVGDVDFDGVSPKASWITPVPGGVGPMTVAMLMANTWKAYQMKTPR